MGTTTARSTRQVRRGAAAALAALALATLAPLALAAPAQALGDTPVGDAAPATVADAMHGRVPHVTASASGGFEGRQTLQVHLAVDNTGTAPVELTLPRAMLFATDDETNQVAVASGPLDEPADRARFGLDAVVTVPVGKSTVHLQAFCGQHGDVGPNQTRPMHDAGVGTAPLRTVATNIAATKADLKVAQDAVWWLTDVPDLPVAPSVAPLLEGVDTKAFAAHPTEVVPDPAYTPMWARSEGDVGWDAPFAPGGGGASGGSALWVLFLVTAAVIGVVTFSIVSTRPRRTATVPVPVRPSPARPGGPPSLPTSPGARASGPPPGWYPDPTGSSLRRWWDGTSWTTHQAPR